MRPRNTVVVPAILAFGCFAAGSAQELPRPTLQNAMLVSLEHSVLDGEEVDYIKADMPFGLYAWLSFSHTAYAVPLDWHAPLAGADAGLQAFKGQVDALIAAAKAKNVRMHLVVCSGLARGLYAYREAKEEDVRNAQWYNDNKIASDGQIGSAEAMNYYVFGTLSRYARKIRANLEAKGRAAAAFLKQRLDENPDTFLFASGWGEVEMNFHRLSDNGTMYFGDYSPFAVLEFRDWLQHAGMYDDAAGKYRGQGYSGGGSRYQGAAGLAQFNADFGTNFATWDLRYFHWSLADDYDPFPEDYVNNDPGRIPFGSYAHGRMMPASGPQHLAGGFDPPRTRQAGNPFWDLWTLFRETMVYHFVRDMVLWAAEAGIAPDRWFSHQIPADYVFGTRPSSVYKNERYYTSASPLWTSGHAPLAGVGATVYDAKFPPEIYPPVYARTSKYVFEDMALMSPNWGIVEYDPELYPAAFPVVQSTPEFLLEQFLRPYSLGAHFINFWRWEDETLEHHIKGMNKQIALREFVRRVRDKARSPDPDKVYDPPKVAGLSGLFRAGGVETRVTGKIWAGEAWDWKTWGDFSHFEVYRGDRPGLAVDPARYLGRANDYVHLDPAAAAGNVYFYKWRAVNKNGVAGPASDEIRVAASATPAAVISGHVRTAGGAGVEGVVVAFSNGGGTTSTDEAGSYLKLVGLGWSGAATASKEGLAFTPASRPYSNVDSDLSAQDYSAAVATYTISGTVRDGAGGPVGGVAVNGLPGSPQTDASGLYSATVDHGWSGAAIPTKTGFAFTPQSEAFASVAADQPGRDFTAAATPNTITLASPNGGETWEAGSSRAVAWTTSGTVGEVKIELSTDGGLNWTAVAASVPNSGSFAWTVPASASPNCLVRVSQAAGGTPMDLSDAAFAIVIPNPPVLRLSRTSLRFGATTAGTKTQAQKIVIANAGGGTMAWTAGVAGTPPFIQVSKTSGTGNARVQIDVNPAGLAPGTYAGQVVVASPDAANSPRTVDVALRVLDPAAAAEPFGYVDTPLDGKTGVEGAFAMTGWALDDVEVAEVKIWRDPVAGEATHPNGYVFIGNAVFIEGARRDVEQANPSLPLNFRSGWGYMVLSNYLPNGGNGTFRLHAAATDKEGRTKLLGSRTISCDNAHAVLPFGAIDTPTQGGTAWGASFMNFGWALTPQPKSIPADGSTIWVWVDGAPVGRPVYNNYRSDVAGLFPGLANSNGAVGYFVLDTTKYEDGLHNIAWGVVDSAGQANGIGSRFFNVLNSSEIGGQVYYSPISGGREGGSGGAGPGREPEARDLARIPSDRRTPVYVRRGYSPAATAQPVQPQDARPLRLDLDELERVEIHLAESTVRAGGGRAAAPPKPGRFAAWLVAGDELRPLPAGSTFDSARGVFFWSPGPGFLGEYEFVFLDREKNVRRELAVAIIPRE